MAKPLEVSDLLRTETVFALFGSKVLAEVPDSAKALCPNMSRFEAAAFLRPQFGSLGSLVFAYVREKAEQSANWVIKFYNSRTGDGLGRKKSPSRTVRLAESVYAQPCCGACTTSLWKYSRTSQRSRSRRPKRRDGAWTRDQGACTRNGHLEQDTTRSPLQALVIMKLIEDLKAMTTSEIVSAFHSLQATATPNMQGAMVVLQLDVNFRKQEANQLYEKLEQLMGQASLQLGGLQIRKEG